MKLFSMAASILQSIVSKTFRFSFPMASISARFRNAKIRATRSFRMARNCRTFVPAQPSGQAACADKSNCGIDSLL